MAGDSFELKVRLTPEKTAERVSSVLGKGGLLSGLTEDTPLIGEISAQTFHARMRAYNRNSWRPTLYGSIEPAVFGCVIRGQFKLNKNIRIFTIFMSWAIFLLLATSAMMLCEGILKGRFDTQVMAGIIVPLIMVGIIIVIILVVAKLARKEEEEFIRQIMHDLFKETILNI